MDDILSRINDKYKNLGQNPTAYLEGLLHAKPITYWDYIQVDTLLTLQKPRTDFPDELIFITYHQIIELTLKLIIHELEQITSAATTDMHEISVKLGRVSRYTDLLSSSFTIMSNGMSAEQYNQFRMSLTPASGFQSAQFRLVELYSTDLENLINERGKKLMPEDTALRDKFDFLYWQDAGFDRAKGTKSLTLQHFEQKYLESFRELAERMDGNNLYQRALSWKKDGSITNELVEALRGYDYNYNVTFPIAHLKTAHAYLGSGHEQKAATGGSAWEKYLHPMYQRRVFFPAFWSEDELREWGKPKEQAGTKEGKGNEVAPGL